MTLAIERAIKCPTEKEKERAARWAAAWGLLCGIRAKGVRLRSCEIESLDSRLGQTCDPIATFAAPSSSGLNSAVLSLCSSNTPSSAHLTAQALTGLVVPDHVQQNPA